MTLKTRYGSFNLSNGPSLGAAVLVPVLLVSVTIGLTATAAKASSERRTAAAQSAQGQDTCSLSNSYKLILRRTGAGRRRFVFPSRVAIANRARIRALIGSLCSLPLLPAGVHCPADYQLRYTLTAPQAGAIIRIVIDPYGCQSVIGFGTDRWAVQTPTFWRKLGAAIGRPSATVAIFRGH